MRHAAIAALLVSGCYVEIEGYVDENVRDHDISFRYTTPIATGQVGRNWVVDGCISDAKCTEQEVAVMNVAIDKPDVLMATSAPGGMTWDATALAPGSATVAVMADNEGVERRGIQVVEVLAPDKIELVPAGLLVRATAPTRVHVPRTCTAPVRMTTMALATFGYKLSAGSKALKGSGYYPFMSPELTPVEPLDRGSDAGGIQYVAGAAPVASTIVGTIAAAPAALAPMPIEIVDGETITAVALSDQQKAPTSDEERIIWAEVFAAVDRPICFDNNTRTIASTTPAVCTVHDARPQGQQYRGAGPYILTWHGTGTCTVSVTVNNTITATKDYTPI